MIGMINPATRSVDDINEFTQFLIDNPETLVKLRNGVFVVPNFVRGDGVNWSNDMFVCQTGAYMGYLVWRLDGSSVNSHDLDMIEIAG